MNQKVKSTIQNLPLLVKYGLILSVVAFISLLFPNNVIFKYEFQEGQSWRYEDLVAPFDFAIQKTEAEIQEEVAQISTDFSPYFEMDMAIAKQEKANFLAAFERQIKAEEENSQFADVQRRPQIYQKYGLELLTRYYQLGIIDPQHPYTQKGDNFVINIIKGNTEYRQTLQNILQPSEVLELMGDSLPYAPLREPEFIFPLVENAIQPNIFHSETLTNRFKQEQLNSIVSTSGRVKKGELIIPEGGIVTKQIYQTLVSYKAEYEAQVSQNKTYLTVFGGYFLLTSLIIGVLMLYFRVEAWEVMEKFNKLLFILMWIMLSSYLVYLVESFDELNAWVIPFCIVPIIIKSFYNDRIALFIHIAIVLIASFLCSLGYEFTFLQILAGMVAVLTSRITRWSTFFGSIFYVFLTLGLGYLGLSLIKEGNVSQIDWGNYAYLFLSVILTLLAYPLIPLLERLFGFTSPIRLMELSDMNRPLLKKLSLEAPGTLQHSLQVSNLAEAAASAIGADQLLVKVGALYHDIGKTVQPLHYIENQNGVNPHDELPCQESAKVIIDHVKEGILLAKKYRLPKVLIDFIRTHHGTTRVEYFYRNFLKENPNEPCNQADFCYPGPKPRSKEQTILMLADSIEAASKSLNNPSLEEISDLVDKLVQYKIDHNQLEDSALTFAELDQCSLVFKQLLKSILHVRIEYPEAGS
ncbi:MAG: HDIG domain-containing metalloprotein [Bacteroidota bacterium]